MNYKYKNDGRVAFLDMAKGLGMLFIIWGHITGIGDSFIYAFHIPLFFFVSGMVFNSSKYPKLKDYLVSRTKSLLAPYLFYSVVTWVLYVAYMLLTNEASSKHLLMSLVQTFIAQGSVGFLEHNVPLWFVTCLFVTQVLYYHIDKLDARLNLLLSAALSALGYLMIAKFRFFNFKLLPWSIESALAAMIFYAVGNIVARRFGCERIERALAGRRLGCLAAAVALGVCLSFGSRIVGHVSLGSDELRGGLLYYIDAFCGTAMVLLASIALDSGRISYGGEATHGTQRNYITELVRWFGRNSFRVMAVHNPIKSLVIVVVAKLTHIATGYIGANLGLSAICFSMTLIVVVVVVGFIDYFTTSLTSRCLIKKRA